MSNNQLAGFPAFGPRVDTTITYNPVAYIPESPLLLPSSEPATAQIQFTVNQASLPTFSPYYPSLSADALAFSDKYKVYTVLGFHNTAAGYVTMSVKYKSAEPSTFSSIAGSSINPNYYGTASFTGSVSALALNTVHEVKAWCNTADAVYLIWAYMIVVPNALLPYEPYSKLYDLQIGTSLSSWVPVSTPGAPSANFGYTLNLSDWDNSNTLAYNISADVNMPCLAGQSTTAALYYAPGLNTTAARIWRVAATEGTMLHYQPAYPTRIAYTPIL